MSAYFEMLMDLWQKGHIDEFISQTFKFINQLPPEEKNRVFHLLIRSLPPELVLETMKEMKEERETK